LIRRLYFSLLTLWGITVVVFILSRLGPDPLLVFAREEAYNVAPEAIQELKKKWGLDRPLVTQYLVWMGHLLRGDLGRSIGSQRPVTKVIGEKIGATVQLGLAAFILAAGIGMPLGVLSAVKRGTVFDYMGRFVALIGQATPSFWLALIMILVFAVKLDILPSATRPTYLPLTGQLKYFILPSLVLAFDPWATYMRLTRSGMLEVLDSEYIKLARAKGVGARAVIWKHAFRNALIQPLTVSALVLGSFITGSLFVETIFSWPGLGRLAVGATWDNDFPVLAAVVLLFGLIYVALNFVADMAYAWVNPRIRYT
jgi:peptide/nickel transport system permease protein